MLCNAEGDSEHDGIFYVYLSIRQVGLDIIKGWGKVFDQAKNESDDALTHVQFGQPVGMSVRFLGANTGEWFEAEQEPEWAGSPWVFLDKALPAEVWDEEDDGEKFVLGQISIGMGYDSDEFTVGAVYKHSSGGTETAYLPIAAIEKRLKEVAG
jgi:hypothetical protein